jgi:hypothetical protein
MAFGIFNGITSRKSEGSSPRGSIRYTSLNTISSNSFPATTNTPSGNLIRASDPKPTQDNRLLAQLSYSMDPTPSPDLIASSKSTVNDNVVPASIPSSDLDSVSVLDLPSPQTTSTTTGAMPLANPGQSFNFQRAQISSVHVLLSKSRQFLICSEQLMEGTLGVTILMWV